MRLPDFAKPDFLRVVDPVQLQRTVQMAVPKVTRDLDLAETFPFS